MKKMGVGFIVSVLLLLLVESASAGYMRCGRHLLDDTAAPPIGKYEVLKKCGEPTDRFGNTWIYERSGGTRRVLHFTGTGRLRRIKS